VPVPPFDSLPYPDDQVGHDDQVCPDDRVYGVVSFLDSRRRAVSAMVLAFESPAAGHAYAQLNGLTHYLVGPVVFDTTTAPAPASAVDVASRAGGRAQADAARQAGPARKARRAGTGAGVSARRADR